METPNLDEAKKKIAEELVLKLKQKAKQDEFSASGKLERSWGYRLVANSVEIFAESYAKSLSDGIKTKKHFNKQMAENLAQWARNKGMQPLLRNKKGQFRKVTKKSYLSLGYILAKSISRKGISKRFGYKGSGFIERVIDEQKKEVKDLLTRAYRQDVIMELNKIK